MASHHPQSPKSVTVPANPEGRVYVSGRLATSSLSRARGSVPLTLCSASEARFFPTGKHTRPSLGLHEALGLGFNVVFFPDTPCPAHHLSPIQMSLGSDLLAPCIFHHGTWQSCYYTCIVFCSMVSTLGHNLQENLFATVTPST